MTQPAFAIALGVSRDLIAKVEGGAMPISDALGKRIAEEFGAVVPGGMWVPGDAGGPVAATDLRSAYTRQHYEEWQSRLDLRVSCRKPPGPDGWATVREVLETVANRVGPAAIQAVDVDVKAVLPKGAKAHDLINALIVGLARSRELEILEVNAASAEEAPAVVVAPAGNPGVRVHVSCSQRGGASAWHRLRDRERIYGRKRPKPNV